MTNNSILDILTDEREITPTNSEDIYRTEMKWDNKSEALLSKYSEECKAKSIYNDTQFRKFKKLHQSLSLPSTIVPICIAGLSDILYSNKMLLTSLMLASGIMSGVQATLNYGSKAQKYNSYSGLYSALEGEIEVVLYKHKRDRPAPDMFIERIYQKLSNINANAPP